MEARNSIETTLLTYKKGLGDFTGKMPEFASKFNAFTEEEAQQAYYYYYGDDSEGRLE